MKPYDRTKWLDETSSIRRASLPRRVVAYGATGLGEADLLHLVLGERPNVRIADLASGDARELVAREVLTEKQAGRLLAALELARRLALAGMADLRVRGSAPCSRSR